MSDLEVFASALAEVARRHRLIQAQYRLITTRRDDLVVAYRKAGASLSQVAKLTGLDRSRIHQIVARDDGGPLEEVDVTEDPPPAEWQADPEAILAWVQTQPPGLPVDNEELQELLDEADRDWPTMALTASADAPLGMAHIQAMIRRAMTERDRLTPMEVILAIMILVRAGRWRVENQGEDSYTEQRTRWRDILERLALELCDRDRQQLVSHRELEEAVTRAWALLPEVPVDMPWHMVTVGLMALERAYSNRSSLTLTQLEGALDAWDESEAWRLERYGTDDYRTDRDWFKDIVGRLCQEIQARPLGIDPEETTTQP
jgi:hypothetical protein